MKILYVIFFLATLIIQQYRVDKAESELHTAQWLLFIQQPKDSINTQCPRCGWKFPTYIYGVDTLTKKVQQ